MTRFQLATTAASLLAVSGTALAVDFSAVPSGTYAVDPTHAYVNFSYNHLGLSNPTLSFDDFSIEMNLDVEDPTRSMVEMTIQAGSVIPGSETWKEHITGPDWFNVGDYPEMSFRSSDIEAAGDDTYTMSGELTVKDKTGPVELMVTINNAMMHPMAGKPVVGISATGQILRSEWGLGKFAPNISDEVQLQVTAELLKVE